MREAGVSSPSDRVNVFNVLALSLISLFYFHLPANEPGYKQCPIFAALIGLSLT